mmetsp:Transcript_16494/g.39486  ORF Transcript_16494/g.39486 Transcript_16494/m.39486 type:complete len:200 (+) Transcript_16494:366-965(+)
MHVLGDAVQSRAAELGYFREFALDGLQYILRQRGRHEYELRTVVVAIHVASIIIGIFAVAAPDSHPHGPQLRTERLVHQQEVDLVQYQRPHASQIQPRILRPQNGAQTSRSGYEHVHGRRAEEAYLIAYAGRTRARRRGHEGMEGPVRGRRFGQVPAERGAYGVNLIGELGRGRQYHDARTPRPSLAAPARLVGPMHPL